MMAPLSTLVAAALVLSTAQAHFTLESPPTVGFDEDKEPTEPCGGFTPDFGGKTTVTNFSVGGDALAMNLLHPRGTWLFRGTVDEKASGGWTPLYPQVLQSGLGAFCQPMVTAPSDWAGKKGVISVAVNAPDGLLFQCAAVSFISGMASMSNDKCKNGSASFSFVSDPKLAALPGASNSSSGGSSTSSPSASPSSTKNAAPGRGGGSIPLGSLVVVLAMGMLGAAYML